jgi:exopolysaccharide biosynthesis polyprenyl glycosylphosphotransferase
MSQLALQHVGADLEQAEQQVSALAAQPEATTHDQVQRMLDLAASYGLFGLNLVLTAEQAQAWEDQDAAVAETAPEVDAADLVYRSEPEAAPQPANDVAPTVVVTEIEAPPETEAAHVLNLLEGLMAAPAAAAEPVVEAPAPVAAPAFIFPKLTARGLHLPATLPQQIIRAIDWVFVALAAEFAALWGTGGGLLSLPIGDALGLIVAAVALKAGMWLTESYRVSPARIRAERGIGGLALGAIAGLIVAAVFAPDAKSAAALSAVLPMTAILLAGVHAAFAVWIRAAHKKGVFSENVVLIGATDAALRLAERAAKNGDARIIAIAEDRLSRAPSQVGATPVGGDIDALLAWEGLPHVDRIVVTVTQKAEGRVRSMIERLSRVPNRVDLLLDYDTLNVRGRGVERYAGAAVACVSGRPRNTTRVFVKRAQDLIIGAGLVALFALPMAVIALLIKLDSRGPALYRQQRHGFNNRIITVLKFRSMRHDPEAPLAQVCANDPRVTRIGAFLRRTSLDELPQLINVLRGEMSLVGPRPHAVGMKAAEREMTEIVAEYAHRHRVKPGITGWAQVNGSRGPVHTAQLLRRRLKLDLEYVSRASLWLDLQILARTAPALLGDNKVTR